MVAPRIDLLPRSMQNWERVGRQLVVRDIYIYIYDRAAIAADSFSVIFHSATIDTVYFFPVRERWSIPVNSCLSNAMLDARGTKRSSRV